MMYYDTTQHGKSKDNERLAVKFRSHFTVSFREDGRRRHIQILSRKEKSHFSFKFK
jgi:hypothetical protein